MAISRRRFFFDSTNTIDIELIDSPEKLLQFAEQKGITLYPLDVERLAKEMGINVQYVDFVDDDLSGVLIKNPDCDLWTIKVNQHHHVNRRRYTIAHEIGHYCRHKQLQDEFKDQVFFRSSESSKIEWQANEFASNLLIPEQVFRQKINEGVTSIEKLANFFGVSTLALRIRAKKLNFNGHGL